MYYFILSGWTSLGLEPCADVIVSAAARRSISIDGGVPQVKKIGSGAAWRAAKNMFYKIPENNFILFSTFSDDFFSHSLFHYRHLHSISSRGLLRGTPIPARPNKTFLS